MFYFTDLKKSKLNSISVDHKFIARPYDISDIDIWISVSILYFDTQMTEKYSTAIWPNIRYLAIWLFGKVCQTLPSGVSLKRALKMQLRNVDLRYVGTSIQKLWPKMDFVNFPLVYPLSTKKCRQTVIFQDKNLKIEIWAIPIGWHPVLTRFLSTREKCFFGSP